jgi:hypothetical protein
VTFANRLTDDFSGLLDWNRLPNPKAAYYRDGFSEQTMILGSRYTPPVGPTNPILQLTAGEAVIADGNLAPGYVNTFTLGPSSKFTNDGPNAMSLSFTLSSGLWKGTFTPDGAAKGIAIAGAALQKGTNGFGYLLGTNQSSSVTLHPAP